MKKFYLNIELAKLAVQDKYYLESLAFNLMVKARFQSSRINDRTVRNINSMFKFGSTRTTRILKNGIKYDLLEFEDKTLVASKVKGDKTVYNALVHITEKHTISQVMDIIRSLVVLNHIKIQSDLSDAQICRTQKNGGSIPKRIRRFMAGVKTVSTSLSTIRIMQIANVKRYKASEIVKFLVDNKLVSKTLCFEELNLNPHEFYAHLKMWAKVGTSPDPIFLRRGIVSRRLSNKYRYTANLIV